MCEREDCGGGRACIRFGIRLDIRLDICFGIRAGIRAGIRGNMNAASSRRAGGTVLLLHDALSADARPDEADVLAEANALSSALRELGHVPETVPVTLDLGALERRLAERRPLAVVNLVESLGGRSSLIAVVPALLEALGVPFTGCPADAIHVSSNKRLAKRRLAAARIPTPALFGKGGGGEGGRQEEGWIVKSVWEHASLGIDDTSIVEAGAVPGLLARRRAEHGGQWFAERFVAGREINVALIAATYGGDASAHRTAASVRVLPPAEIRFDAFPDGKARIVGYAAKWQSASFEYLHTPRSFDVEPPLVQAVEVAALACWEAFELAGYARVDFRIDAEGRPWVLEVNTNPCLSPDAGFAAALEAAGIGYTEAVARLLDDALRRAAP
jgi:D-alanine-D-alanine ligase